MTTAFTAVDDDALAKCVACGLCLPHCPTYRITGFDSHSPRGRIALVGAVRDGRLPLDGSVIESLESCVQCMGCLPACPSGVRYDEIIHPVIEELARRSRTQRAWRSFVLMPLGRPRTLRMLTRIAAVAQRIHALPKRLAVPTLRLRLVGPRRKTWGGERPAVELFAGCVMSAWFGDVHKDTVAVLWAMGYDVKVTDEALCCGALHSHAGLSRRAESLLGRVRRNVSSSGRLVVNSAGCGAHLAASGFGVVDIMSFLEENVEKLPEERHGEGRERVMVHDACHARNLLQSHMSTHRVLSRWYEVASVADDGLCCGAGGAYSLMRPDEARSMVARKFDAMTSSGLGNVRLIASGNPGCTGHMTANLPPGLADTAIVHPIQLVARMLGGA